MRKIYRSTGIVEIVCEHGTGHPTYESAKRVARDSKSPIGVWLVHGCCGDPPCCSKIPECNPPNRGKKHVKKDDS